MTRNTYHEQLLATEIELYIQLERVERETGDLMHPEVVKARSNWNAVYKACQENGLNCE